MSARVAVLRGRTSDRTGNGVRGAEALGAAVAERLGVPATVIGEPGAPREAQWRDDLRDAAPVLFTWRQASTPLQLGIVTSMRMTSGSNLPASATASTPSRASPTTSKPASVIDRRSPSRSIR